MTDSHYCKELEGFGKPGKAGGSGELGQTNQSSPKRPDKPRKIFLKCFFKKNKKIFQKMLTTVLGYCKLYVGIKT